MPFSWKIPSRFISYYQRKYNNCHEQNITKTNVLCVYTRMFTLKTELSWHQFCHHWWHRGLSLQYIDVMMMTLQFRWRICIIIMFLHHHICSLLCIDMFAYVYTLVYTYVYINVCIHIRLYKNTWHKTHPLASVISQVILLGTEVWLLANSYQSLVLVYRIYRLSMGCHTVSPAPVWVRIPGP